MRQKRCVKRLLHPHKKQKVSPETAAAVGTEEAEDEAVSVTGKAEFWNDKFAGMDQTDLHKAEAAGEIALQEAADNEAVNLCDNFGGGDPGWYIGLRHRESSEIRQDLCL
ncbi:MAG: hypothetical protein Q4C58_03215 [Eubacteriales bacterium]|nr:hypothetical protein [Eubacteriales bacterium]